MTVSAGALVFLGCAQKPPAASLPNPDVDIGLGDVVMMTWTTRSDEGLLGHVMDVDGGIHIDPQRRPISGDSKFMPTDQRLHIVVAREQTAAARGGYGPIGGGASVNQLTHVAYDVRVTGYTEILPKDQEYVADSGCCVGGSVSGSCGEYFVMRLIRGSGTVSYLQKVAGEGHVSAANIVRAEGGASFRKLSHSEFQDTYFAYEVAPLQSVCGRLSPLEELPAMEVSAPDNCFLSVFHRDGTRRSLAWNLPSENLCRKVAEAHCDDEKEVLDCQARRRVGDVVSVVEVQWVSNQEVKGEEPAEEQETDPRD